MDSRFWLIALLPPVLGFCLDAILGDPHGLPYRPVQVGGKLDRRIGKNSPTTLPRITCDWAAVFLPLRSFSLQRQFHLGW